MNKHAQYKHSASASSSLPFPQPSSSSDLEETPNFLVGEIGDFTSLLPVLTTGLIGLLFLPERDPLLLFYFRCMLCFSKRGLGQARPFPVSVDCTAVFFSNSALYGQTVMIFAEPGLADIASLCALFWNWRQWTQTCSLHCSTCWSYLCNWSGRCWFMSEGSGKIRNCNCRLIRRTGFV